MNVRTQAEIRTLPPLVVNQIAAGEVVERPASVVKELVDNAIDSGATQIGVELEQGGIELVRVTDNGSGIPADQLPMAVAPHATSKIRDTSDLDRIATMGFRGEALASIASVSRMSIRSRTPVDAGAMRLDIEGTTSGAPRPDAGPVGTSVSVRNLFFNTPARRKFLRTAPTEQGHACDIVRELALAHPAIGFSIKCDGRITLDLPPNQSPRERALAVIGGEMESQYLEVNADQFDDARGLVLWGLAGLPVLARPTPKWQHLFLNGRPVRDRTIQHALKEAYRGLIEPGRHPAALVMIEMDPGAVDVNVHPAKSEVRFRDSGMVHKAVYLSVRDALRRADLTPATAPETASAGVQGWRFEPTVPVQPPVIPATSRYVESFHHMPPVARKFEFLAPTPSVRTEPVPASIPSVEPVAMNEPSAVELPAPQPSQRVLQVHNSFLVTQDEHGVVIIDQHALHERVMFEKLKQRLDEARASGGGLESQSLLVPAVVPTTPQRIELVQALSPMFQRLGIVLEPLGSTALGVQAFPTFLFERKVEPGEFIGELLDRAEAEPETFTQSSGSTAEEAALHEVLDMMACKAAIKAGDQMSQQELAELLALREEIERSSNCPHGRPTALRLTIKELERQFGRS